MNINLIILPFISFLTCSLIGRIVGSKGTKIISTSLIIITFLFSLINFIEICILDSSIQIPLWYWFNIGILESFISLSFNKISSSMLILVTGVSSLVHMFSTSYMEDDPHLPRFMGYLSLFTFFMILLVISSNLLQLFIGWEGVGVCSYLLINFWFTRIQANKSAIKAMIINKVGDMGLILGIILIWIYIGSIEFNSLFCCLNNISNNHYFLILSSILLLIGVTGKSAQIGLHTWLPDAMEGPTPVSALIHAATMVTAGVFLLIKMSPLFEKVPTTLFIIVILGSLTAFISSTIGITQHDLKKVIAYSTCSQLGYMVMICGFSQYNLSLFHLINHGFFKALLFLSAGSIIHAINNEQDMRKTGSLKNLLPLSYICIFSGSISLMGLPFLTGFYSKDLILEVVYGSHFFSIALWLGLLSASLTAFYSFRLIYFSFFNSNQTFRSTFSIIHEGKINLYLPLLILIILSIMGGWLLKNSIMLDIYPIIIPNFNKSLPLILSIIGGIIPLIIGYTFIKWWNIYKLESSKIIYSFAINTWYFNEIMNYFIVNKFSKIGLSINYKLLDNQILEFIGPYKIQSQLIKKSSYITDKHSGKISLYLLYFIIFISFFLYKNI